MGEKREKLIRYGRVNFGKKKERKKDEWWKKGK